MTILRAALYVLFGLFGAAVLYTIFISAFVVLGQAKLTDAAAKLRPLKKASTRIWLCMFGVIVLYFLAGVIQKGWHIDH